MRRVLGSAIPLALAAATLALVPARPASAAAAVGEAPGAAVVQRTYRLALLSDPTYAAARGARRRDRRRVERPGAGREGHPGQPARPDLPRRPGVRLQLVAGHRPAQPAQRRQGDRRQRAVRAARPCFTTAQLDPLGTVHRRADAAHPVRGRPADRRPQLRRRAPGARHERRRLAYLGVVGSEFRRRAAPASPTRSATRSRWTTWPTSSATSSPPRTPSTAPTARAPTTATTSPRSSPAPARRSWGTPASAVRTTCSRTATRTSRHVNQDDVEFYVAGDGRSEAFVAGGPVGLVQPVRRHRLVPAVVRRLRRRPRSRAAPTTPPATIKAAVLQTVPAAVVSNVRPFFKTGSFDDRGFTITYTSFQNVVEPTVVTVAGVVHRGGQRHRRRRPAGARRHDHDDRQPQPGGHRTGRQVDPGAHPVRAHRFGDRHRQRPAGPPWEQVDSGGAEGTGLADRAEARRSAVPDAGAPASARRGSSPTSRRCSPATPTPRPGPARRRRCGRVPGGVAADDGVHPQLAALPAHRARPGQPRRAATEYDEVTLTLDKTAGPLRVTSQATVGDAGRRQHPDRDLGRATTPRRRRSRRT